MGGRGFQQYAHRRENPGVHLSGSALVSLQLLMRNAAPPLPSLTLGFAPDSRPTNRHGFEA